MQPRALRCVWPRGKGRTLEYFFSVKSNARSVLRNSYFLPRRVVQFRRPYTVDERQPISSSPTVEDPKLPVGQRLKILFRKYRWPSLAVYLGLSVVDFGISFLAVRAFGTERIGQYEKVILQKLEDTIGWKTKGTPPTMTEDNEGPSIWTELALAYTIHKTLFALIRVPLTVAITPPLVKWYHKEGIANILAQLPAVGRLFKRTPAVAVGNATKV